MTTETVAHRPNPAVWAVFSAVVVIGWFAAALSIALNDGFRVPSGSPPLPILLGVAIPLGLFLALTAVSGGFRAWLLSLDTRLITAVQHWRVVGAVFLALLAFGQLPGSFAWPAGLGDVAIGLAALWVTGRVIWRPGYVASGGFLTFHLLGILDFVVAFGTGIAASAVHVGPGPFPMGVLPLVMIPGFLVPLFTIFHLIAILQWRAARRR